MRPAIAYGPSDKLGLSKCSKQMRPIPDATSSIGIVKNSLKL